ncbi:MAG: phage tail tape measure protein, partial [Flavobacteriaceae bacterium]
MPESVPLPLKGTITNQSQLERQVADIAKKAGRNLKINLGTNAKDIKSLEQPLGRITGKADEFGKSMEAANARVIAFGASVGIINAVVQSFKSLVNTTIEVEKNLAKINSILKTTTSGLNALKGQIFDIARNTEQTFDTVAEAALELSRQGLSATEVTKRLNDALILSRLSGISAAEAVAGLTAAVNSFTKAGLTTGEVLNKISNAANQFAVSERDLIEGFKRSASVAEQAGVSIDELGGIITAVQQKTARGGAVIGNSFKTIFTRIGRAENLELLKSIGVEIQDLQGNILPATKLIENLGKQLENLDDIQVRSVTEKIGGGFQIAPLLAALSDYSSETSIAIKATEAFRNATDQAYQKNIILNQTLSAAINSTSLTIKELANSLGELGVLDPFKEILNIVNNLAKGIKELLPSKGEDTGSEFAKGIIKGLSNALIKGGLAVFGLLLFELSKNLLKFGVDSFKTFLGLNKEAEKLKNIQAQIIQTLISDKGVREQILSIERLSLTEEQKRAKQAEFFNAALRERVALTSQLNKISVGVAGGIRTRQATRRGAGGYLPIGAEQSDISKGVGGAPSGAKPVVIPNFAFGGGKRGTMVANSSEYIVPNFAGGGSAIFNQDMVKSMGLPSGAKKINAAGGFVPNFATFKFGRAKGTDFQRASAVAGSTVGQKYGGQVVTQDDINKASLFVKSNKSAQQTNRRKTYDVNVNKVLGSDIPGMLIPKLGGGRKFGKVEGSKALQSKYPGAILNATFPAFPIDLSSKKELKKEVEKTFGQGEIEKYVTDRALKIAKSIASSFALPPVEPNTINAVDNVKGFISSAVGAFGGIFDAAMTAAVGLNSTDEKGVGDFDVDVSASNAKNINKVFGRRAAARSYLDNKINQNQGISMLAKTLSTSEYRSKIEAEALTQGKKLGFIDKKTKKAARGYIPNFAMSPLEDAIQREKEAGVPINQIRVNQDGGLRNSRNPDGLAVTNTRDEPTGAIPKNASRGYVPNFAAIDLGQA